MGINVAVADASRQREQKRRPDAMSKYVEESVTKERMYQGTARSQAF